MEDKEIEEIDDELKNILEAAESVEDRPQIIINNSDVEIVIIKKGTKQPSR